MYTFFFYSILLLHPSISSDGVQYFSWIHAPIIHGNLNFTEEYTNSALKAWVPSVEIKTPTGLVNNIFFVGSPLMNAPFFLFGHFISYISGLPTNGYTDIYFLSYDFGTIFYSFIGSWIIFIILTKYLGFKKSDSMITVLLLISATPLISYIFVEPSFSHGDSYFAVSLLTLIWLKYRNENNLKYWAYMGLCIGLIFLIRFEGIVFVLLPIFDLILNKKDTIKNYFRTTINSIAYLSSMLLAFSPQIVFWKIVYGKLIPIPMPIEQYYQEANYTRATYMDWNRPHVADFFFSAKHGLISWHPLFALLLSGYYFLFQKYRRIAIISVIMCIVVFYMLAAPWDWWGGWAFGQRRIALILPILSFALVAIIDKIGHSNLKSKIIKATILISFSFWNMILLIQWLLTPEKDMPFDFFNQVIPNYAKSYQYLTWILKQNYIMWQINHSSEIGVEFIAIMFLVFVIPTIIMLTVFIYDTYRHKSKINQETN